MSKKKKTKKKPNIKPRKKKSKKLSVIISASIALAVAVVIIVMIFISSAPSDLDSLCDVNWVPSSAHNSSGDEVELAEVYNTHYSNYEGSMSFSKDGTFSLWLSPGLSEDGTHSGKFEIKSQTEIEATFDNGTVTSFYMKRENNDIACITINYDDYKVDFVK